MKMEKGKGKSKGSKGQRVKSHRAENFYTFDQFLVLVRLRGVLLCVCAQTAIRCACTFHATTKLILEPTRVLELQRHRNWTGCHGVSGVGRLQNHIRS